MTIEALVQMFKTNDRFVLECVKGITHEESLVRPQGVANSFNWILAHVVHYRDTLLELLGHEPLHTDAERQPFKRDATTADAETSIPLETLVADFQRAGERLHAAVQATTPEQLEAPYNDKYSVQQRLVHLTWHEAYHVGQLAYLRRLAGKERIV